MSFKKRLSVSLIAVALFPIFMVSLFLLNHSIGNSKEQYLYSAQRLLESNTINLDRTLSIAYESVIQLVSTPDLIFMLHSIQQGETDLDLETKVDKTYAAIHSLQNLEKDIFDQIGVYAGSQKGVVLSSYHRTDRNIGMFYEKVKKAAGKPVWIALPNGVGSKDLYIAAAALRPYNNQVLGMVYIKMKYEFFRELMDSAKEEYGEYLFLVGNGQLITSSYDAFFEGEQEEWYPLLEELTKETKEITVNKERYLIDVKRSNVAEWYLIFAGKEKMLIQAALSGTGAVIFAAFMAVFAALVMAAGLSYSAYLPIHRMLQMYAKLDRDSLGIRMEETGDSDLKQITSGMNQMMEQMNQLIEETEKEKEARFGAEMAALRAQINPHFLYNTLNVIKCLAASGKKQETEKACVCLIQLLRTSIGNNRECITLGEELSYVKNYTELVLLRQDKQFELIDQIPDELVDVMVPKFTLQPIIENAIIHGFSNKTQDNTIFISAYSKEGKLFIRVTDNGEGMEEEKVQELEALLGAKEGLLFSKVGIFNVNERLHHIFGEEYGLQITSYQGEGTQVQVCIPLTAGRICTLKIE